MPLSETQAPITVVLVEDDRRTLTHLLAAIDAEPRLRIAAAFERGNPARAWIETNVFDVLLTDIGLPDGSGIDVIRACVVAQPHADIMVVSMFGDEQIVLNSIEAGATGYILKDADGFDIARSILDLRAGGAPMSPLIARRLISRVRDGAAAPQREPGSLGSLCSRSMRMPELTRRESETLNLISRGYTYKEIGALMGVSVSTVQTYIKSIYSKLSVNSRGEAVFESRALGLLDRARRD